MFTLCIFLKPKDMAHNVHYNVFQKTSLSVNTCAFPTLYGLFWVLGTELSSNANEIGLLTICHEAHKIDILRFIGFHHIDHLKT